MNVRADLRPPKWPNPCLWIADFLDQFGPPKVESLYKYSGFETSGRDFVRTQNFFWAIVTFWHRSHQ